MNEIKIFQQLLKYRSIFKAISQLSWNIAQLEKRYPIDNISEEWMEDLLAVYHDFAKQITKINDEVQKMHESQGGKS